MSHTHHTIKQIQQEASDITDESLASTERIAKLSLETVNVGSQTLSSLSLQREKLAQIEEKSGNIKNNMVIAEKELTEMEKCCGCFSLPWKRHKLKFNNKKSKKAFRPQKAVVDNGHSNKTIDKPSTTSSDTSFVTRITNDEREDKMEKNMHIVSGAIKELKSQADTMSHELDEQKEMMDRIGSKLEHNNTRVIATTKRTIELL